MNSSFSLAAKSLLLAGGLLLSSADAWAQEVGDVFAPKKSRYKRTLTHIQFPRDSEEQNDAAKRRLIGARDAAVSDEDDTAYIEIGHDGIALDTAMIRKKLQQLKRIKSDHHIVVIDGATVNYTRTVDSTRVYVGTDFENPSEENPDARIPAADVFRIVGETLSAIDDSKREKFDIIVIAPAAMRLAPNMSLLPVDARGLFMTNVNEALAAPRYGVFSPDREWSFGTKRDFDYVMETSLIATLKNDDAPHLVTVHKKQDADIILHGKTVFDTHGKKLSIVGLKDKADSLPRYFRRRELPTSEESNRYYPQAILNVPLKTLYDAHKKIPKGGKAPQLSHEDLRLVGAVMLEKILDVQEKDSFEKRKYRRAKPILEDGSDWFKRCMVERVKPTQEKLALK